MASRNTAEFLNNILLQRVNGDLPYAEDARWSIRQHVLDAVQDFPSLTAKLKNYQATNGRPVVLLLLEGTVPIYFRGVLYNIPVSIWIPEKYPRMPPYPFVTPTPDMIIKPNHCFVSSTGYVNTSYMVNWRFPTSNLNEMIHDMAILFGTEPPLFSKPPGWTPPYGSPQGQPFVAQPPPQAHPEPPPPVQMQPTPPVVQPPPLQQQPSVDTVQVHNPLGPGGGFPGSGWPPAAAQPTPSPPQQAAPLHTKEQLQDSFRQVAVKTLAQRLAEGLRNMQQQAVAEAEELRGVHATLAAKQQEIDSLVTTLQSERNSLESNLNDLSMKRVEMESWLDEYEKRLPVGDVDADAAIVPADTLSGQALEAHALDLSIEETLYCLDKALQRGMLQPEAYLKQVRQLCRKQYYARALGSKIAAQQAANRKAAPPAAQQNPSQRSLAMPQGDSWVSTGVLANPLTMR